jgi:hypothetical protein
MIKNDQELQAALARIRYLQQQVEKLRQVETNPTTYRLSVVLENNNDHLTQLSA